MKTMPYLTISIIIFYLSSILAAVPGHSDFVEIRDGVSSTSQLLARLEPGAAVMASLDGGGYRSSNQGLYLRLSTHLGHGGRVVIAYMPFQIEQIEEHGREESEGKIGTQQPGLKKI